METERTPKTSRTFWWRDFIRNRNSKKRIRCSGSGCLQCSRLIWKFPIKNNKLLYNMIHTEIIGTFRPKIREKSKSIKRSARSFERFGSRIGAWTQYSLRYDKNYRALIFPTCYWFPRNEGSFRPIELIRRNRINTLYLLNFSQVFFVI